MQEIKVLVVDDHHLVREGISMLLQGDPEINTIAFASNGLEALSLLKTTKCDVVLMDINMPEMNGIEATEMMSLEFPNTHVIALSMNTDMLSIRSMLRAGASAFLPKEASSKELRQAIISVFSGKPYLHESIQTELILEQRHPNEKRPAEHKKYRENLSKRELEIVDLIAQECTSSEIAERLSISIRTVEAHRRNIMGKLGLKNVVGLVLFAIESGILRVPR